MSALRIVFRLGLPTGFVIVITALAAIAQQTSPKPAPALRNLTDDDVRRAAEIDKSIEAAIKADRWDDAIARAEELLALRTRVQGPKHFEAIDAQWRLETLRRIAPMPPEDRAAFLAARDMSERGKILFEQGKFAESIPLNEKALEIRRRLLTAQHPDTTDSALDLAGGFTRQGKFDQAQRLIEEALEIRRRLLGDDHPRVASCYSYLAFNLSSTGKLAQARSALEKSVAIYRRAYSYDHHLTALNLMNLALVLQRQGNIAQAQPLFEKALEIQRRVRTDDHSDTAFAYHNLAANLNLQRKYPQAQLLMERAVDIRHRLFGDENAHTARSIGYLAGILSAQGKYAEALPLHEKALEIRRRVLTDQHPETAASYNSSAIALAAQGKFAEAQRRFEKALEIRRSLLTDQHPDTALTYFSMAENLRAQGKYAQAEALYEKSLEIHRSLLSDDHPTTARNYGSLASDLDAQGKYREARDRWRSAVKSLDSARLQVAFTGLERVGGTKDPTRPALAVVLARLGQPRQAWQSLEEDLGRGLLDELTAREGRKLTAEERASLRDLTTNLERLDRLVETTPRGLDQAGRAKRFEDLKRRRELASIALSEFQAKLVQDHGPLAGEVATLEAIQAALPADAALIDWVDLAPPGPNAADPDGEHWGVVVRSRGTPAWIPIPGTGPDGLWTKDDSSLANRVRTELRRRPVAGSMDLRPMIEKLRAQRLESLAKALGATDDGQPRARRLIVLPSRGLAGIPVEAMLAPDDTRTVSYAPSATVFKYLRGQPRPDPHAGLLALGDPVYERPDSSNELRPKPGHGLLVQMVAPGSNAATHGLKDGDVLLSYNGRPLNKKDDLKIADKGDKPIAIEVWRDGRTSRLDLAAGKLGAVLDPRPAPEAIAANRAIKKVLVTARSGDEDLPPLPGTRYEIEALTRLFKADGRPTRSLLGTEASEPELDSLAASGELSRFGFIHLATHGVIDEGVPTRSAVILTQTGLPDPLEQVLQNKPAYDGRLSVRELQRTWDLRAELVTLSACETALGRESGGESFVGFTQALLMSGTRSVCLSLWKVDDTATALLMQRFYGNLLGRRPGLTSPMPKAEALREAKSWLRELSRSEVLARTAELSGGFERGKGAKARQRVEFSPAIPAGGENDRPYASPHFWAAFVLSGDPD